MKAHTFGFSALVLSVFLAGCGGGPDAGASPAEPPVSRERARLVSENLLAALNDADYAEFSRDFSPKLQQMLPEENFEELRSRLDQTSGRYLSMTEPELVPNPPLVDYSTSALFERERVSVWIWFEPPSLELAGIFLDSPGLQAWTPDDRK